MGRPVISCRWLVLAVLSAWGLSEAAAFGQFNERPIQKRINVEDKDDVRKEDSKIWVLDITIKDPRLITVDIPGRGRQICWYMLYRVTNPTGEPRRFIPNFELVALDKPAVYRDEVLPAVQKAILQIEDPLGHLNIKNSVTIAGDQIPAARPGSPAPGVNGVAIWTGVNPDANRFSVFVSGLSNGWSLAEIPPDNRQVIRRKTLQLNFKRLGDRYYQRSGEIQFVPPYEWVYRNSAVTVSASDAPAKAGAPKAPAVESSVPMKDSSKR
jgi:hypothetical protein